MGPPEDRAVYASNSMLQRGGNSGKRNRRSAAEISDRASDVWISPIVAVAVERGRWRLPGRRREEGAARRVSSAAPGGSSGDSSEALGGLVRPPSIGVAHEDEAGPVVRM